MHKRVQACMHAATLMHAHTHMCRYMHAATLVHVCTHMYVPAHQCTHRDINAGTHVCAGTPSTHPPACRHTPTRTHPLTLVLRCPHHVQAGGSLAGGKGAPAPFPIPQVSAWHCPTLPPTPCHAGSTCALCHHALGGTPLVGCMVPGSRWAQDPGGVHLLWGAWTRQELGTGRTDSATPPGAMGQGRGQTGIWASPYSRRCRRGCGAGAPGSGSGRRSSGWTGQHPAPPCSSGRAAPAGCRARRTGR